MATLSDSTVEGGPGLILVNLLDVLCDDVNFDGEYQRVLSVQCLPLLLPKLVLVNEHVGCLGLDVLEGSEGDVFSWLLLLVRLLSPCSLLQSSRRPS